MEQLTTVCQYIAIYLMVCKLISMCACADEDEDILPVKERASTYVTKLLSWRPQCLFGTTPESDEEDEKEHQRIMEELDNLPLPNDDGRKHFGMFHN